MTDKLLSILETAKDAARVGGEILRREFGRLKADQISLKGMGDYVTEMDRRSERAVIGRIKESYPDHAFLSEESGEEMSASPFCWIIDPLDGTANYVQGLPLYSVSIAVRREKEIIAGVVYDPSRDEMFWATEGGGAYMNGLRIRASSKTEMAYSMLASGFPWRSKECIDPYMDCFKELFLAAAGIRRMGSAAVDLAYTACGRFDGFWEMKLAPWDIAAGILILQEAGGVVTDFLGGKAYFSSGNVVAGNPAIQAIMLEIVRRHLCAFG